MRELSINEVGFVSGGDGVCTAGPNGEVISHPEPAPTDSSFINVFYDTVTFPIEVIKALINSLQNN